MGLFDGLGQAAGAAAGGYLRGQNLGNAEGYRRKAQADAIEARREALRLQRKAADPQDKIRAQYGEVAKGLIHVRNDPAQAAFFNDPANAALRDSMDSAIDHSLGLSSGQIDLSKADPHLLTFHPSLPGPSVPDKAMIEGKGAGPATGPNTQPTNFETQLAGRQMAPPPVTAPSNVGPVRQAAGLSPGPLPFQMPAAPNPAAIGPEPTPVAAPAPAAAPPPPAKFDPQAEFQQLYQQGPPSAKLDRMPYETDKAFDARKLQADKPYNAALDRAYKAATGFPKADIARADAAVRPEMNRQKIAGTQAGTQLKREQTRASKVITPVKVESGKATAAKARTETRLAPQRLGLEARRTAATERNAATVEGQLAESKRYHDQLVTRAKDELRSRVTNKTDRDDHEIISANLRILTATKRDVTGSDVSSFTTIQRLNAQKKLDAALQRVEARKSGAAAPAGAGTVKKDKSYWTRVGTEAGLKGEGLSAYLKSKGL